MRLPEHAAHAIRRLERAGFEAWAVGGCVRDSLRGVEPHDWDLCTSASPAQMQAVFADARVSRPIRHGTLTVLTDGGPLEITTYRTRAATGRATRTVRFVTIREDLHEEISLSVRWRGTRNAVFRPVEGKPTSKTAFCARSVMLIPDFRRTLRILRGLRPHPLTRHRAGNRRCHGAGTSPDYGRRAHP
ncbi:MAG: hypothetical protein ACLT4C_03665 [Butyricicoccus sp.]